MIKIMAFKFERGNLGPQNPRNVEWMWRPNCKVSAGKTKRVVALNKVATQMSNISEFWI